MLRGVGVRLGSVVLDGCLDDLNVIIFGEELGIEVELEATYKEFTTDSSVPPSETLITHAESVKGNSPGWRTNSDGKHVKWG